ncbi:MAG: T9SS type A sorting domain-containing protein [Sphingobacteriaceae bacterium]|nr:T9SS type A sorting domain-containing protein [Sphingobacteriaceae bacterium]
MEILENSGNKVLDIVTNAVGTMASAMLPSTAWTSGNVNCGTATCNLTMTNLKTITVSACTGLAELSSGKQDIIVYPNPTNSTLSIKTEETIESATVYNLLGSVVLEETNKSFSVEQLPAGVYTLKLKQLTELVQYAL